MKKYAIPLAAGALLSLAACVAYVEPPVAYEPAPVVVVAPVLPAQVILETRPYYVHGGYYYYWHDHDAIWLYSKSNRGPWYRLPRSHYPARFQYKGRWHEGGEGRGGGRDKDKNRHRD